MTYRPDIDGLRGIAVLLVVLFHFDVIGFSGGFIGVDIFFVISGYLMTSILLESRVKGSLRIRSFYESRARRIIPPLFTVCLFSIPVAILILNPIFLKDFGQSLLAVNVFASNFLFYIESGYFDSPAELKPLLHTWSLGVEAQFYFLVPLLFLFVRDRSFPWLLTLMIALFLTSLVLHSIGANHFPKANFYLLLFRLWEFQLGCFVALYLCRSSLHLAHSIQQTMSLVGAGMILYFLITFDENTSLTMMYPALPTIGSALLILFGREGTYIHKLLTFKPLMGLGLISYSLYLWHYPIIVFLRHSTSEALSTIHIIVACLCSVCLAIASWRWVEVPFRDSKRVNKNKFYGFVLFGSFILISTGLLLHFQKGFANDDLQKLMTISANNTYSMDNKGCDAASNSNELSHCLRGDINHEPVVALLGDSHAISISNELSKIFEINNASFLEYAKNSCPNIIDFVGPGETDCNQYMNEVMQQLNEYGIKKVMLLNYWGYYTRGHNFHSTDGIFTDRFSAGDIPISASQELRKEAVLNGFQKFIEMLLEFGMEVYVFLPVPEHEFRVLETTMQLSNSKEIIFPAPLEYKDYLLQNFEILALLKKFSEDNQITIVGSVDDLCTFDVEFKSRRCLNNYQGELLYFDDSHLTDAGARLYLKDFTLPE